MRASAIDAVEGADVAICVDAIEDRAEALAARYTADASTDWRASIIRSDVDAVVVATGNNLHSAVAVAAAEAGKHILCERPLARNPSEGEQMVAAVREYGVRLKMGFSRRHAPVMQRAREIVREGRIGKIIFMRGRTGRGGYSSPSSAWMVDCELSGGGTLLDNGMDLLDLCSWFMGDFRTVRGYIAALVWPIDPCEDNAFGILTTSNGRAASIHSSWTDWQGYMSIDITGSDGYIKVDYDNAVITTGSRPGAPGAGLEETLDLSGEPDRSLMIDVEELMDAVSESRDPQGSSLDGLEALILAHAIYKSSEEGQAVRV